MVRVMAVYKYFSSAFKDLWSLGSKGRLLGPAEAPGSVEEVEILVLCRDISRYEEMTLHPFSSIWGGGGREFV